MINEEEARQKIVQNLIYYRKKAGMTQIEAAELLSYSDKAVSKWERGLGLPDVVVLIRLAEIYGTTLTELCESDHSGEKPVQEVDEEYLKFNQKRHRLITWISVGLVWLTSTILFFIFKMIFNDVKAFYLFFIYSIPASFVVILIFNLLWGQSKYNAWIESLLSWSLAFSIIITIFPLLNNPVIFYILLIPLAFQTLIILFNVLINTGRIFSKKDLRKKRRQERRRTLKQNRKAQ